MNKLVKEVKGLNPSMDAADIRSKFSIIILCIRFYCNDRRQGVSLGVALRDGYNAIVVLP